MAERLGGIGGQGGEPAGAVDGLAVGADARVGVAVGFHVGRGAVGTATRDLGARSAVGADLVEADFKAVVGGLFDHEVDPVVAGPGDVVPDDVVGSSAGLREEVLAGAVGVHEVEAGAVVVAEGDLLAVGRPGGLEGVTHGGEAGLVGGGEGVGKDVVFGGEVAKVAGQEFGVDQASTIGGEVGEELVEAVVGDLDDVVAVEVGGEELLFTDGTGNAGAFEDDLGFGGRRGRLGWRGWRVSPAAAGDESEERQERKFECDDARLHA